MHWNGGDKYNVIGYIGQGAFAMVYKLSSKQDGEVYAVKEIDKGKFAKGGSSAEKARKELDVIRNLQHVSRANIKYLDTDYDPAEHREVHRSSRCTNSSLYRYGVCAFWRPNLVH